MELWKLLKAGTFWNEIGTVKIERVVNRKFKFGFELNCTTKTDQSHIKEITNIVYVGLQQKTVKYKAKINVICGTGTQYAGKNREVNDETVKYKIGIIIR